MDDLKEEILDIMAVLREKLKHLVLFKWVIIILPLALWPFLYVLLTIGLVKMIVSGFAALSLVVFCYNNFVK